MNLLTVLASILAVSSASQIYNNPPSSSFLDYQQSQHYQPQSFTAQTHQIPNQDPHSQIINQPDHGISQQFVYGQSQNAIPQQDIAIQSHAPVAPSQNFMHQSGMPFQYTNFDQNQFHQQNNYADVSFQGLQAQQNQVQDYSGRQTRDGEARILNYQFDHDGHNYQYAYETENGIRAQEAGTAIKGTAATGGYSYTGDDGQVYSVTYTADENGFRASGAHLPTPPPIPKEIAEALEKNARDEANGINDDGQYIQKKQDIHAPEYEQAEIVHQNEDVHIPKPTMSEAHK